MSTMPIDSIYLGWTPESFSIRIYRLCFLTSDSSSIWSHWNPNGSFHVQQAEVCYLLLLSHCWFFFSSKTRHYWPPVLSWSWWPLLSLLWYLGCSPLCLAFLLSLLPSFWVVYFSPFPLLYTTLIFLSTFWFDILWVLSDYGYLFIV